ncbi:TetR-like C-terminal domain-containing protein, partial [Microbacterium sp. GbtcB4]|uniref:TetR-like C-terminal domain-containing protein n=1 Tax=Microbacterium sp. GbtcB4 TaxID=2824749 RepID=UPI001C30D0CA
HRAKEHADSPEARIQEMAYAYWRFAASQTAYYRIMFSLGIPHCETVNSVVEMKQMSTLMFEAIADLAKTYQQPDIHLKLKTFWSMLHGFIS